MYCNNSKHISELISNKKLTKEETKQLAGIHVKHEMRKLKFKNHIHSFSFMMK